MSLCSSIGSFEIDSFEIDLAGFVHFEYTAKTLCAAVEHSERRDVRVNCADMEWEDPSRAFVTGSDNDRSWPLYGPLLRDVILPVIRRCLPRLVHLEIVACEGTAHLVQAALATFVPAPPLRSLRISVENLWEEGGGHPVSIPHDIFNGIAPTLRSVDLTGCILSNFPTAALASVTI